MGAIGHCAAAIQRRAALARATDIARSHSSSVPALSWAGLAISLAISAVATSRGAGCENLCLAYLTGRGDRRDRGLGSYAWAGGPEVPVRFD